MIEEGTILQKRYRFEKQIGQGGMGAVYMATDERFGSTVAIKETLFFDKHYQKAFKREARLLNSLKHSALPKVSDHFIEDNGQYIVMEYIGGDDLFEKMEKTGTAFTVENVLDWTRQLLEALEYLHGQENPVIHRDIKPQNLKLTPEGKIILLDFGLAKGNPTDANHQTAANSIFGYSRNYASLEQIQGTGTDPRSDIYSLAATMYHLVAGKLPSDALTRVMLVLNEENDPLQPAHKVYGRVPEGFSELLYRAMSLNANIRPQSTSEMREMLFEVEETGVFSAPVTASERPVATNLFTQNTKVMSGDAEGQNISKNERKTEVLPVVSAGQDSVQTRIVDSRTAVVEGSDTGSGGIITRSFPTRSGQAIASVLALLVLMGSLVAGIYFFNPEMFGRSTPIGEDTGHELKSAQNSEDLKAEESDSSEKNEDLDLGENRSPAADVTMSAPPKQRVDKKPKKKTPQKITVAPEWIFDDGETKLSKDKIVTKDGTVVTNGKIETKELIIDGQKVRVKTIPVPPNVKYPMTRKELEGLTPAQRRKIRKAMDKKIILERQKRKRTGRKRPPPRKPRK